MGKPLSLECVANYFKEQGCELLSNEYKGNQQKLKYRCSCGNIAEITFASFQQGSRCKICRLKKYTQKYVEQYFLDHNCILLGQEYINNQTPMKYQCECGNVSCISFSSFLRGTRCKKCGIKKFSIKRRLLHQDVYDYFKSQNCELLDIYINNQTKMKYRCSCGNISYIAFNHFKQGQRCMECSGKKKITFDQAYECFKERGFELLDTRYINDATKMKYKCSLGHINYISLNNLKQGYGCRQCANINNSGPNNNKWNPNLTDEERKENESRQSDPRIKSWRKQVFKRDGYTCQICGSNKRNSLKAHHLDGYNWCVEKRYDVDNGITLDDDCHLLFHSSFGYGNNTKLQFEEFLLSKNHQIQL